MATPKKPTRIRRLTGNPGKRAFNPDEPAYDTSDPAGDEPPITIAADLVAAAEWRRLAPLMRKARVLTDADRATLLALCQQWSIYQDALTQCPANRRVIMNKHGAAMVNPYFGIADRALRHCERMWVELGLTPSARSRVVAGRQAGEGDPFAEFDDQVPRYTKGPTLLGNYGDESDDDGDAIEH